MLSRYLVIALTGWVAMNTTFSPNAAAPSPDRIRAEVTAAREAVWRAWFANDRPTLDRLLPDEFVGIAWGGGPFDSRETALAAAAEFVKGGGKLRRLAFANDRFQIFGNVVTVFSTYHVELESGGRVTTQTGRATEVFVHRNGVWTNPAWHLDSGT